MTADESNTTEIPASESTMEEMAPQNGAEQNENGRNATATATAGAGGENKKHGGRRQDKKNEVPIEELYDLSKPIKRIERPSKEAHESAIAAIDAEIETLKATRSDLQSKIDATLGSKRHKDTPVGRERDALNKLKNRKGLMIEQKRQIRTKLEIVKAKVDRLMGDTKNARSGIKFTNTSDIDKEISKLQYRQETSSMSLADEKRLIKEIEALQLSKRTVEDFKSKQGDLDSLKQERKTIQAELTAKDKEIDSIQREVDSQTKVLQKLMDQHNDQRGQVDKLVEDRDAIKAQMDEKTKEKINLRSQFREQTNDWYNNQRAIKAQRQLQYQDEKKRREEEHASWLKKREEEEMKKVPYEEEMALCDYLADYLQKTYLVDSAAMKSQMAEETKQRSKADVVALKDDPFAGLKAFNKKKEDEIYFGKSKSDTGSKKNSKSKKNGKSAPTFSLNLDLWEQFGLLDLIPPTSLDDVAASVEELKAKKVWYSQQPRGSVLTAKEIRKANSERAAKSRSIDNQSKGKAREANGKEGSFSFANDDFVPLTVGVTVAADKTTWGK